MSNVVTSEKPTYAPPTTAPPIHDASQPQVQTPQVHAPTPSYGYPATTPQQQYPPPQGQAPQPFLAYPVQPLPAGQMMLGEQYRAQLFAQCAAGVHEPKRTFGIFGMIMAVACFPCGLICLFSDSEEKCNRCGVKLS